MSETIFVSNSSPIIAFERLRKLSLLQQITHQLYIPTAVRQEVFSLRPLPNWIIERPITQPVSAFTLSPRLGQGECEAIVLALEMLPNYILLDDLSARQTAQSFNITVIGTVGLLILARQRNLIVEIKPHLDDLIKAEFHISKGLYQMALKHVGE